MTDIAPPATALWYDLPATVTAVLAMLRLIDGDVDQGRIASWSRPPRAASTRPWTGRRHHRAAAAGMGADRVEPETIALYRAQSGSDPSAARAHRAVRDSLVGGEPVAALLRPHRARWGVS